MGKSTTDGEGLLSFESQIGQIAVFLNITNHTAYISNEDHLSILCFYQCFNYSMRRPRSTI